MNSLAEYDPKVDWSKLEVDTPILVRVSPTFPWKRAHFSDLRWSCKNFRGWKNLLY